MTFRIEHGAGFNEVNFRINNINQLTRMGIRKAWFKVGADLKRTANTDILAKNKTGRTYIVKGPKGRRRRHRASAPFEAHANMRGTLRKSIGWKVSGTELTYGYGVTRDAPKYAKWIEFGTKRMLARPSLRISITKTRRNTINYLEEAVRSELT